MSRTIKGILLFFECRNFSEIFISKSVTCIGTETFEHCFNLTIYAEGELMPEGWGPKWNINQISVVWGYEPTN